MIKIKTRLGAVVLTAFWPLAGLAAQCPDEQLECRMLFLKMSRVLVGDFFTHFAANSFANVT